MDQVFDQTMDQLSDQEEETEEQQPAPPTITEKTRKRMALVSTGNMLTQTEQECSAVQTRFLEAKRKLYVHAKGSEMAKQAAAAYRTLRLELAASKEKWSEARTAYDRSRGNICSAVIEPKAIDLASYFSSIINGKKPAKRKRKVQGQRIALTWGDAGENHVGMEQIGDRQMDGSGFTMDDLRLIAKYLEPGKLKTELVTLDKGTGVLVIRKFLNKSQQGKVFDEVNGCKWDTKYWDTRRKKVLNKQARSNLLFVHGIEQPPSYEEGMGTIIDADGLDCFCEVEERFKHVVQCALESSRTHWTDLVCEGNNYADVAKNGIGFHGDTERTRVVCLSLGTAPMVLRFLQFKKCRIISGPFDITVEPGDMYIMSENALGSNWKKRSQVSWRHAAGSNESSKYLKIQKRWIVQEEEKEKEKGKQEKEKGKEKEKKEERVQGEDCTARKKTKKK